MFFKNSAKQTMKTSFCRLPSKSRHTTYPQNPGIQQNKVHLQNYKSFTRYWCHVFNFN